MWTKRQILLGIFAIFAVWLPKPAFAQVPLPPTQVQASFQNTGNQTDVRWSPQGTYRVAGDVTINASYDFSAKAVLDSWQSVGNRWSQSGDVISLNTLLGIVSATRGARVWGGGVGLTDFHFGARVRFSPLLGSDWGGILFRVRDQNNYYFAGLYGDRLSLSVVANGTIQELGTFAVSRQNNTWYTLRVRVRGSLLQVDLDGQQRISVTNTVHASGTVGIGAVVTSLLTLSRQVDFSGPTKDFELREAGGMVAYQSTDVLSRWTKFGTGNWTAPDPYRLYQSLNTEFDTGFYHTAHLSLKDYTYVQEMWISSSTDDDVMGLLLRYKPTQASPHRFSGYVFEWSRGGALQPFRRLVRVNNGGYGQHTGSWQRINHTVLRQDNVTWATNTLYTLRAQVKGNRIRIWINEQLWADVTDTSADALTEGAFGPFNWSNPDYNVRHMTLYYDPATLVEAVTTPKTIVPVAPAWTRLQNSSVGTLLSAPYAAWLQSQFIPTNNAQISRFHVIFEEATTFEGMVSPDGVTANPTNASAFAYGRQKAGSLRYHVYRNTQRLTNTPITTQSYVDRYDCRVTPGTQFDYQVSQLNPANQESALSTPPASVTTANDAPTLTGVPNQTGAHGTAWTLDLAPYAKDLNLNPLTITTDSAYITVNALVLRFLYPLGDKVTAEDVTITVTDCHGAKASLKIKVTLENRAPAFTSQPPTSATTGILYAYNAQATDPDDGDTLTYALKQAPAGATVNPQTGELRWTPPATDAGKTVSFVLEVCDNRTPPRCVQQSWQVVVTLNNRPPQITSTPPTAATEDQSYAYTPVATDPDGDPITWRFAKAPTGATIDPATGRIAWTPGDADAGKDVEFEIQACDNKGACTTQSWKTQVTNVPDAPVFTSTPPTNATEDQVFRYRPTATDPDPGASTLTYKLSKGPQGAVYDPATGEVIWVPGDNDAGKTVEFEVEVCDQDNNCTKQAWKVTVANTPDAPKITSTPPTTAEEKKQYNYKPTATDPDPGQTTFAYRGTKLPPGATVDPNTGELKWTPGPQDAEKEFDFEIEVCDQDGNCSRQAWKVKVSNVNDPPIFTSQPPTEAFVGRRFSYAPSINDPDAGDAHTWKITKGPAGATIDPTTGEIQWTPSNQDAGKDIDIEIEVCDNGTPPACAKQSFRVKVKVPCAIDKDCPQGEICIDGVCAAPGCAAVVPKCPQQGDFCSKAQCNPNPCTNNTCAQGEFCRPSDGQCAKPCSGVQCPQGERCVDGSCVAEPCARAGKTCAQDEYCDNSDSLNPKCVKDPCKTSNDACRYDRACSEGRCSDDPCALITCPDSTTQRCVAGQCVARQPCQIDLDCGGTDICVSKRCIPAGCHTQTPTCPQSGQLCLDATCKDDTCKPQGGGNPCGANDFCRPVDGQCVKPCAGVQCPQGQVCQDGACQPDLCAGFQCPAGQICVSGQCEADRCNASNTCKHGRICRIDLNTCAADPCLGVTCPLAAQVCRLGQCAAPPVCRFDKDCPSLGLCVNGVCVNPACGPNTPCPSGKQCANGICLEDPCTTPNCATDQACRGGVCVGTCAGVFCPQGQLCTNGQCVPDLCANVQCKQGEACKNGNCQVNQCQQDSCKDGRLCEIDRCLDDPCQSLQCPQNQSCQAGQCTGEKVCKNDLDCSGDGICLQGKCAAPGCYRDGCPTGEICLQGKCTANPCANKQCAAGEHCRATDNTCVKDCPTCPAGEVCVDGQCQKDPCAGVSCKEGERCENGACVADACVQSMPKLCKFQRDCKAETCKDDPCTGITCATGQTCRDGICVGQTTTESNNETSNESSAEQNTETTNDGGEVLAESSIEQLLSEGEVSSEGENSTEGVGEKTTGDSLSDEDGGPFAAGGGCACSSGSPTSLWSVLWLLLLGCLVMRRRSRRVALPLVCGGGR